MGNDALLSRAEKIKAEKKKNDEIYNAFSIQEKVKWAIEKNTSAHEVEIDHLVILFRISEWGKKEMEHVFERICGVKIDAWVDTWRIRAINTGYIYVLLYLKDIPTKCDHKTIIYSPYIDRNVCQLCGQMTEKHFSTNI